MRLNRITLANLNQNEIRRKKEIIALSHIDSLRETKDNLIDFSRLAQLKILKIEILT